MNCLSIGKLTKPFGVEGSIKIESFSGEFDHFFQLEGKVVNLHKEKASTTVRVLSVILKGHFLLMRFEGFITPENVSRLSGFEIKVKREFLAVLNPGELYIADLIGCEIIFKGTYIGKVDGYYETYSILLDIVTSNQGHILIPYTSVFIGDVDTNKKIIQLLNDRLL